MAERIKYRNPVVPVGEQILRMRAIWPGFSDRWRKGVCIWEGVLKPTEASLSYSARVEYRLPLSPRVTIITPELHAKAPHRYSDGVLCLYRPTHRSWHSGVYIADSIIPWTAEWLFFYEVWLETGKWYGPEAKHKGAKRR
jgi:hypothetical protein